MEISVKLSIIRVKTKSGYKYEVWEIGSAPVRMGDWERRVVAFEDKKRAVSYVKRYAKKLKKQYGEHITVKII